APHRSPHDRSLHLRRRPVHAAQQDHHHRGHGLRPHHPGRRPRPLPLRHPRPKPVLVHVGRHHPRRHRRRHPHRHPPTRRQLRRHRLHGTTRRPIHLRHQRLRRHPTPHHPLHHHRRPQPRSRQTSPRH